MKRRWICAVAGLWLGASLPGLAAAVGVGLRPGNPFIVNTWDTDEGLPQSTVTSILQSRDGYLWFGTLNGLVRFDGLRFAVFDENNTPGLNSGRIVKLFEDRQANLWMGTESAGVAFLKEGQLTTLGIGQGAFEKRLVSACEDALGAVWLCTANGELWRQAGGRWSAFVFGPGRSSACRTVIAESDGPVWVGADWRLSAISPTPSPGVLEPLYNAPVRKLDYLLASSRGGYWRLADNRVQKCRTNQVTRDLGTYPWGRANVTAACEDRYGNLVVGTLGAGVYWYDADGPAAQLSVAQGLSHENVLSLCLDREGSLWVGTDGGGLNRVKRRVFEALEVSPDGVGSAVQSVCEDPQGGLWIGINNGGVAYWKDGVLQRFGPNEGLPNPYVWTVFVDRGGTVWAGTWGGGLFQWRNGQFQRVSGPAAIHREAHALHQDRRGRLWLGTQAGLAVWDGQEWKVFTSADGFPAVAVQALADDAEGNLWVGTVGGGLYCLREGKFTVYRRGDGLPSDDISALLMDGAGVLWVGTAGSGLARFDRRQWTRYTTREGLLGNSINYLLEDDQGCLWLGSNAGLMRIRKAQLNDVAYGRTTVIACRAYGKADGLPARECTLGSQPAACRSRQGKLWFPTTKGLTAVDPARLHPNPHPPPVLIETVLIQGQAQNTNVLDARSPRAVTVPPGKERLEIHYTSLNLAAPDRARFKYRLEGYETAWAEVGNTRVARYSRLPPGRYRFSVTACNEDGLWNDTGSALAVVVEPPLWRTWWFLSATAFLLLGTVAAVVHLLSTQRLQRQLEKLRQQEALEQERSRIARDIHDQLGASLTQVALLGELVESDKDSPADIQTHARQISQTAREITRVLDEIVWVVNPSNDTLDGLITYLCKYAQDYLAVAGLRYRLDAPAQLPATPIEPEVRHNVFLAAKEAITNVVRHAQATAVWLRLRLEPGAFSLEVQDNGRGTGGLDEPAAQTRNGLRNMRQRMAEVGGSFAIGPAPAAGTVVRLTVPLKRET